MMIIGATLFGCGLKRDEWKTAVRGVFLTTMGSFGVLISVIAYLTGKNFGLFSASDEVDKPDS